MAKKDEVILMYCGIKDCYGMDTQIEDVLGKKLTLCRDHSEEYRDAISDIILLDDKEWMQEWAHENLKDEIKYKWDILKEKK